MIWNGFESIHVRKTGALINASLELGAICAGAESQQIAALSPLTDAGSDWPFKSTDDLLDVRGDAAAVGKRVGKGMRNRERRPIQRCWA